MSGSPYVLAIDIGGTKIAAAVYDSNRRRIGDIQSIPTMAQQKAAVTLINFKRIAGQAISKAGLDGPPLAVGVGSTGPVDTRNGVLRDADSLPNLMDFNLSRFIEDEFQAPLFLENDANCFALGEALAGAGQGHDVVVGVTLGTGFGCGIVVNGRIFTGVTGNAGEVAYLPVAGGNFDEMLSGAGVARFYRRVTGRQPPTPAEIGELAERGDPEALTTWEHYGEAVGTGLGIIAAIVDPNVCVVGGSVSQRFPLFREALERKLRAQLAPEPAAKLILAQARLDGAAGVTGAAHYAFQCLAEQGVAAGA